jgi:phosphoribosylformylglycinamidine synthase
VAIVQYSRRHITVLCVVDTVDQAAKTPDTEQPWETLGLRSGEYQQIIELLGRRPTGSELAMYSLMWSEHCSYKSSKIHLQRFGELGDTTPRGKLLAGIGENAGVIDIGQGYAVTFKIESHNHPSFVEPHQGAATGVGGIVRDILAMGARPVGVLDALRFGSLRDRDTARVAPGVVAGVGGYANCLGLPNIGGETVFDANYQGNPLVNALCVGVLRHEDLQQARASGPGNKVVLFGATTGGDGIGGASVLASETFQSSSNAPRAGAKRPSVQVGDPFTEKLLIECTLELFAAGVVTGIGDLGAAGLSCATAELASAGQSGMHIDLDRVRLRDHTLGPEEILMSESQERMIAVTKPDRLDEFLQICAKWDVLATTIGEVSDDQRLVIDWYGRTVVDVDPQTVAGQGPVYQRPVVRPEWQDELTADSPDRLARPRSGDDLAATLLALVGSPNLADTSWVTAQYDRFVGSNTVLAQPDDCGMLRIDERTGLGVALATDCNARFVYLDPYAGAQLALAEAYRNVAVSGAQPVAVSDCLNFGSPEDPAVMWQFSQTIAGLVDGCRQLGMPVTGGNVSFYNQTGDRPILPTPVVGVLGVIDDVATRTGTGFEIGGDLIVLLGETADEFGGSAWAGVIHDQLGGLPPSVDLDQEKRLAAVMIAASGQGLLSSAHDLSGGGLGQAVAEACLRSGHGATLDLPADVDPFVFVFSESAGRVLVSLPTERLPQLTTLCAKHHIPLQRIGTVGGDALAVKGQFEIGLDRLRRTWQAPIPEAFAADDPTAAEIAANHTVQVGANNTAQVVANQYSR